MTDVSRALRSEMCAAQSNLNCKQCLVAPKTCFRGRKKSIGSSDCRFKPWIQKRRFFLHGYLGTKSSLSDSSSEGPGEKELDDVPRGPEIFSSRLHEIEQLNKIKQEIDQVSLDLELLRLEKNSADVTHSYYLSQRFASLQQFTSHLQEVLREQTGLRQRLMKPLCQQNLPIQADLHRYVVTLMAMVVEFIETLEMKMKMVHSIPTTDESMRNLNNGMTQLLAQVTEVESLTKQVLRRSCKPKDNMSS